MTQEKPILIWVHGWATSPDVWRDQAPRWIPEGDHRFVSFKGCETMEECRQRIGQAIREAAADSGVARTQISGATAESGIVKAGSISVIGWSLGGMLAMEAMSQSDSDVPLRLVMAGSTLCFVSEDPGKGWHRRAVQRMLRQLQAHPEQTVGQFHSRISEGQTEGYPLRNEFSRNALAAGLTYLIEKDLTPLLSRLRCDLYWIHGTLDEICPPGAMPPLPDERMALLHGAGHMPFAAQPERFYGTLRKWIGLTKEWASP